MKNKKTTGKSIFLLCIVAALPLLLFSQYDTVAVVDSTRLVEPYADDSSEETVINYFLSQDGETPTREIQVRRLPDSLVNAFRSDDAFWYANESWDKPEVQQQNQRVEYSTPFYRKEWFRALMWIIIIGGFVAVVIWYLSLNDAAIFRRRKVTIAAEEEDAATDNIFDINYGKELNKAIAGGNYRLAVRLLFLQLLKNLSEKEIISYKQDRTNFDYLLQLQQTGYYNDFFRLTRNYEYTWYGRFDIGQEAFDVVKKDFENFNAGLTKP